jgi:hypothetical protein
VNGDCILKGIRTGLIRLSHQLAKGMSPALLADLTSRHNEHRGIDETGCPAEANISLALSVPNERQRAGIGVFILRGIAGARQRGVPGHKERTGP